MIRFFLTQVLLLCVLPVWVRAANTCDPKTQPFPHWGMKNDQCLKSCGHLGGTQSYADSCSNHGMSDAGLAYDVAYCCKASPQPIPIGQGNFTDLVLAGYQGWFGAAGDQSMNHWSHWAPGVPPRAGNVTFELYPDLRDYNLKDLFQTALGNFGNGQPARLFSSAQDGVVETHFKWMSQYGIDGVVLQRFVSELSSPPHFNFRNQVTQKVRTYAEAYGKAFYVMYDITSANGNTVVQDIQNDWVNVIENSLHTTSSKAYARQDNRPVVGIWGFGFTDRPGTRQQAQDLIQWFKNKGVYVVGGVPYDWRTSNGSSQPGWTATYAKYNMILPWTVGAYSTDAQVDWDLQNRIIPDKQFCELRGIHYQRVIFPGFAWSNWNGGTKNMIPRRGGNLFWRQAYSITGVSRGAFIAMFDEYDEGTAIAKAAENKSMTPSDQYFLTLDADGLNISSDFYLRLGGAATLMIRGTTPKTLTVPVPHH